MKHLRWSAAGLCIVALAACDSTPVEPGTTPGSPDGTLTVTAPVLGAVPVLDGVSGHLYDAVAADGGINWTDARAAAEGMSSGACRGYLASITSAEENDFILGEFGGGVPVLGGPGYWIGGFEDLGTADPAEGWMWVSGEMFDYADWAPLQPDGVLTLDAIRFVGSNGGFTPTVNWEDAESTATSPGYVCLLYTSDAADDLLQV